MTQKVNDNLNSQGMREIAYALNKVIDGGINTVNTITLTANTTTTTITDNRLHKNSHISLTPTTANARDETYFVTYAAGSLTITHTNNAQTDRTYSYSILG